MSLPVAAHTFDLVRAYLSQRDSAAPGSGIWSNPILIFDGTAYPAFATLETFSAGALTDNPSEPRGIVGTSKDGLAYIGNGLPDVPVYVTFAAESAVAADFWDMSQGAWSFGGNLYLAVNDSNTQVRVLKSTDSGSSWSIVDSGNGPASGHGDLTLIQRIDGTLVFFTADGGAGTQFKLFIFDLATDSWGVGFAPVTPGGTLEFHNFGGNWNNTLIQFGNGDYIVLYGKFGPGRVVYRIFSAGAWSAESTITGVTIGYALLDPNQSLIHVFNYDGTGRGSPVIYSTIAQDGTVTPSIFTIPATVGQSDAIGHPSIQLNMLFVPRDDFADFDNAVWVAALSDGQFFKELLPIPPGETNQINSISLGSGGAGYVVGDTFTINGGVYSASGFVLTVSGGAVTGVHLAGKGGGYSVASGVATTPAGTQPGVGSGLTVNILTVGGKTPSCAYMMFPNGYTLGPGTLTLACPVSGGSATIGVAYSKILIVSGGTAPYTFSAVGLPPGLTINTSTGTISGIPTTAGAWTYTATVVDANGLTASVQCSIVIPSNGGGGGGGGSVGSCRTILHLWQHSQAPQVEITKDRNDDWTDCGTPGLKFFQGFKLDADTFGANKTIQIRSADDSTLHAPQPSPINHAGRQTKPYSFATPFLAHSVRRESLDSIAWRKFGITYVWEPSPEFTYTWKTQRTSHGLSGFHHVQRMLFAYASSDVVTLTVTAFDGVSPAVISLPSTGGVPKKVVIVLSFNKGLTFQYGATSPAPFQIWKEDIEVMLGSWSRQGGYLNYPLLGGNRGDNASL